MPKIIHFSHFNSTQYQNVELSDAAPMAAFVDPLILPLDRDASAGVRRPYIFDDAFSDGIDAVEEQFFPASRSREQIRRIAFPIHTVRVQQVVDCFLKGVSSSDDQAAVSKAEAYGRLTYWYLAKIGVFQWEPNYSVVIPRLLPSGSEDIESPIPNALLLVRMAEASNFAQYVLMPLLGEAIENGRRLFSSEGNKVGSVIPLAALNYLRQISNSVNSTWQHAGPATTYNYMRGFTMAMVAIQDSLRANPALNKLHKYICKAELEKLMAFMNFVDYAVNLDDHISVTIGENIDDGEVMAIVPRILEPITGYLAKWLEVSAPEKLARAAVNIEDIVNPSSRKHLRIFVPSKSARRVSAFSLMPFGIGIRVNHDPSAAAMIGSMISGAMDPLIKFSQEVLKAEVLDNMGTGRVTESLTARLPETTAPKLAMLAAVLDRVDWSRTTADGGKWTFGYPVDATLDSDMTVGALNFSGTVITKDLAVAYSNLVQGGDYYTPEKETPFDVSNIKETTAYDPRLFAADSATGLMGSQKFRPVATPLQVSNLLDAVKDAKAIDEQIVDPLRLLGIYTDKLAMGITPTLAQELSVLRSFVTSALSYVSSHGLTQSILVATAQQILFQAYRFYGAYVRRRFDVNRELLSIPSPTRYRTINALVVYNATQIYIAQLNRFTVLDGTDKSGLGSLIALLLAAATDSKNENYLNTIYDVNLEA